MSETAVSLLLEQMNDVVKEYKVLISGAENEFEQLIKELDLLKAFLKGAVRETEKDGLFRELERRIRDVVYDVGDSIDTCLANARSWSRVALFRSKRVCLAQEFKSIREGKLLPMLNDAKIHFPTMQIADGSEGVEAIRTKLKTVKPIGKERLVGFENEGATITGYLMEETEELDIITIIGLAGQGKTTLAYKIYQNANVSYHFPIRIWVCISSNFNIRAVFLQILSKFTTSQDTSNLNDYQLARVVSACLENERFLLVLDDLWSVMAWDKIRVVLPLRNGKGKVLVTSRVMNVGWRYRSHILRFLYDHESWTLLQYNVFGNSDDCPPELRAIGENIAFKCRGLTLAIVVVGGILVDQLTRSQTIEAAMKGWELVSESMSDASKMDPMTRIEYVVSLSYHRLPDELRYCFIYLGVFPEDYEIPVKMLFGLWIAEGLVQPKDGRSLEESAEENLNDLIGRNLLLATKINRTGNVKTCRVHDVIREFCIIKSIEQNLFREINKSSSTEVSEQKYHGLCFYSDLSTFLSENPKGPHRSFLCFYKQPVLLQPEYISAIPDGFHKLRILESKSIKFHQFPRRVTNLIHLRYLTLCIDTLKTLPEPISQLWNLQTLIVETRSHSITMKANMWRMIWLRHLKTNAAIVLDSEWKGEAGKNLQTLNSLSPQSCTEVFSKKATNLKMLGIFGRLDNVFESKFLEKLQHLENLKLVNSLNYEATYNDLLRGLPRWNCFPPNLKRLTLRNTFISWQHMSTLAMIKSLEVLKLKDNAFVGVLWDVYGYDFPNLQLLLIVNTDLVLWQVSTDTFPSLRHLVVMYCENLEEIPECLGTHLEKLEIERLRRSAVQSAKKIEETFMGKPKDRFEVQFNLNIGPGCETE